MPTAVAASPSGLGIRVASAPTTAALAALIGQRRCRHQHARCAFGGRIGEVPEEVCAGGAFAVDIGWHASARFVLTTSGLYDHIANLEKPSAFAVPVPGWCGWFKSYRRNSEPPENQPCRRLKFPGVPPF